MCKFDSFLPPAPNTSPMEFEALVLTSRSIYLSWTAPNIEDRNGVIRGYQVNVTETNSGQMLQYSTTNLFITIEGLHPSYTYWCSVSAFTVATGPFSNASIVTLPEDGWYYTTGFDNYDIICILQSPQDILRVFKCNQ